LSFDLERGLGDVVAFVVDGAPAPQGSKTIERTAAGAAHVRESSRKVGPWRDAVALRAREAMAGRPPLTGPLELDVAFLFARPRSHYRTGRHAGQLKPSAPVYCDKRPDLDKLLRAIGDAITGIVAVDDAAIVELRARKAYGSPAAHIAVRTLSSIGG
jgi:Holliday junction resolvase RusA-like endonuclease